MYKNNTHKDWRLVFLTKKEKREIENQKSVALCPTLRMSKSGFEFRGVVYTPRCNPETHPGKPCICGVLETEEEFLIQKLLVAMNIQSIHHVHFPIGDDWGVSPDFVFDTLFVWAGGRGDPYNGTILLGIEAKCSEVGRSASYKRYRLLATRHRVPILILTRSEIEKWFSIGRLPLKRATREQYEKLVA